MRQALRLRLIIIISIIFFSLSLSASCEGLNEMIQKAKEISESLSLEKIIGMLFSDFSQKLKSLISSFGVCFAVITVGIVFSSLKESFLQNERIFDIIANCILILSVSYPISICFSACSEQVEALCGYMLSFVPTSVMLYAASGSTFSASIAASSVPLTVSLIEILSASVVLPLIKGICSLTLVNTLCKKTNLAGLSAFLKSVCLWVIGLGFTLFTGVLSLQSLIQSGLDNLTIKGLKYGAARLIPIAGGMISESMRTVISSVSFIKSVTGISGIVFIIFAVIPNLCTLLSAKLIFSMLSAFAKGTMQENASSLLDSLGGTINILLSLVIGVSVSFIIVFAVFMKTGVTI